MLLLFQLDLGGRADVDDGHAAGHLRYALFQLLAVVVAGGLFHLCFDLVDATLDFLGVTVALDERRVVLIGDNAAGAAEVLDHDLVEATAKLFGYYLSAGQDGYVLEHFLAAVAVAGSLDGHAVQHTAHLVDDHHCQGLALDVLGNHHQVLLAALHELLKQRQHVVAGAQLLVGDEDVRVLDGGFHAVGVGYEIGRDVAAVELHTFHELDRKADAATLFHRDDAVFADFVHHVADEIANIAIGSGDRGDFSDLLLARYGRGDRAEFVNHDAGGLLQAALHDHGVDTGNHVAVAFVDERVGQHGRGGRAVTGDVVRLARRFLDELGADVLEPILKFDFLGDSDAVVGDHRRAVLLAQCDIAPLGTERGLDRVGHLLDAAHESAPGFLV